LVAFAFFMAGCTENLDLKPIASDTEVSYYKDSSSIDATVTGAYAQLCARDIFDRDYYLVIGSIPSDDVEAGGESVNDFPVAQHFDQLTLTSIDDNPLEDLWRYCYKGCRLANTALEKMQIPDIASQQFINVRSGEMKFMVAFYHFALVQTFGGVPIADKTIQPDNMYAPRNTVKEVLQFCEESLKEAIEVLPEKNSAAYKKYYNNQIGRASKTAAQALLAKVLLYESSYAKNYAGDDRFKGCTDRYAEALQYAEAVINSGEYSLVGINGERFSSWRTYPDDNAKIDGYRWLFTVDGDNSSEGIFEVQSVNDGFGWGSTRGNSTTVFQTCRKYRKADGTLGDIGGWSFNCPTDYLVKAFRNEDPRESNLNSKPGNETDDPRFATTVGREGDSIQINDNGIKWVKMDFENLPTKMIGRKYECGYDEYWKANEWTQGPFNLRLIRYADVILYAAEAAFFAGDKTKALNYVNMVRTRARNCGTTGKPENLSAISFEDIVHERRLELTLEPHRFFDLVRWGLAEKFISGIPNGYLGETFTTEFIVGKHEFFPLPSSEVILSKGTLVQYPAWQ
jgi:hypothetical protein